MFRKLICAVATFIASSTLATADPFPAKQIELVVPFAAKGATDLIAHLIAPRWSELLHVPVVVKNIAGAGGTTGSAAVAAAVPDGYTLVVGHMGTHGAAPSLYPQIKYDPATSFEPIGVVAWTPMVLVSRRNVGATNLQEFLGFLRKNDGSLNQAHAGLGSVSHISSIVFNRLAQVHATGIPFSNSGSALDAIAEGEADYMCDQLFASAAAIRAGRVKALAVTSPTRLPIFPDLPTTREAGMPDFNVSAWNAVFAPKGTPPEAVAILARTLDQVLDDAAIQSSIDQLGATLPAKADRGPAALGALVSAEVKRWREALAETH